MKTSLEHLKPLMRCSVCQHKHEPTKALFLDEYEGQTAFHLGCASCGVSTIVFVSANQMGMVSMGVLTDLEANEAKNLFVGEAISSDHVLGMHAFFKKPVGVKDLLKVV